jgi:predicted phage tail protein
MLRDVILHGELGRRFGERYRLDVRDTPEALRALILQVRGFRQYFREHSYHVIRGPADERGIDLDELTITMGLGNAKQLHFIPVVAGSGGTVWKILAGVALIATAIAAPQLLPAEMAALSAVGVATKVVLSVGISLALSGIADLISPTPQLEANEADKGQQRQSFLFGADTATVSQGGPVPLVFGRARTRGVLVSAGLTVQRLATSSGSEGLDVNSLIVRAKLGG